MKYLLSNIQSFVSPPIFFFNDTSTTEIYTLSLHDALPILPSTRMALTVPLTPLAAPVPSDDQLLPSHRAMRLARSEEHTSELQSQFHLVCRLLLEKKKNIATYNILTYRTRKSTSYPPFSLF